MPQIHPGFRKGYYYGGIGYVDTMTTQKLSANRIYLVLTYIPIPVKFTYIGIAVSTAAAANTLCRLGIYGNNQSTGYPDKLVEDFGTVNTSSNGNKEILINYDFVPGWYYLAALPNSTPTVRSKGSGEFNDYWGGSISPLSNASYLYMNSSYSSGLPDTIDSYSVTTGNVPYMWLRRV
jgi:hypothetical protein